MSAQATASSRTAFSLQEALNLALRRILGEDERAVVLGEDVGTLGGVFRVTDGLQREFGPRRVFDTPLAESGIIGTSVGLAMAGWHPIPEIQFDGFGYPAIDQIVNQMARMHYRSRGALAMPITLRLPSFGGIRAPEHHSESLEALFAHVPGLKVVAPATPAQGYRLLRQAAADPDPVVFMEPKARYWHREPFDPDEPYAPEAPGTSRVARPGRHVTLVCWGAMVNRCLQVAELAAEDGVHIEVLDLQWLKPIDVAGLAESVRRTRRAVVVHEAPHTAGLGAEVCTLIAEHCFAELAAPPERVTGYDVPYPAGELEDAYLPDIDRILSGVQHVLEYRRA